MMASAGAVEKLNDSIGTKSEEFERVEINEAFAAQTLAVTRECGFDPATVNTCGGGVALGHPVGASGARILVTLLHEMEREDKNHGLATLCLGGGNAVAMAVER
jgi:acetyl-CoA C-acetyltransferase